MNPAAEVLSFPYRKGLLEPLKDESRLLFLNAEDPQILKDVNAPRLMQPRYDKALPLIQAGHAVENGAPAAGEFDTVWMLPSKDLTEAHYLLALALHALKTGGAVVAAAANDAGGKRLEGIFEQLGLVPQSESKNKCRIVFAVKEAFPPLADEWLKQGEEQKILDGISSRPGIYGWDKIDAGSALLARQLPALSGHVADFGCGWGYLSLQAAGPKDLRRLTLIDVDSRAVELAEKNIKQKYPEVPISTIWTDLSRPLQPGQVPLGPYDFILLNPPFHDGTQAVPELGQAIITTAAKALKASGTLYLVANKHLPYEKTLRGLFARVEPMKEEEGFKTFACAHS